MDKLPNPYAPLTHRAGTPSQPGAPAEPSAAPSGEAGEAGAVADPREPSRAANVALAPPRGAPCEDIAALPLWQRASQVATDGTETRWRVPAGRRDGKVSEKLGSLSEEVTDLIAAGRYASGLQLLFRTALAADSTPTQCAQGLALFEKERDRAYRLKSELGALIYGDCSPTLAHQHGEQTAFLAACSRAIKSAIVTATGPTVQVQQVVLLARVMKTGRHKVQCTEALLNSLPILRQIAPARSPEQRGFWKGVWHAPSHEPLVALIRVMGRESIAADLLAHWGSELYEQIWMEADTRGCEDSVQRHFDGIFNDLLARSSERQLIGWLVEPLKLGIRSDLIAGITGLEPFERRWILQALGHSDPHSRMLLWPALLAGRSAEKLTAGEIMRAIMPDAEKSKKFPFEIWIDLAFAIGLMRESATPEDTPEGLLLACRASATHESKLKTLLACRVGLDIARSCQLKNLKAYPGFAEDASLRLRFAHMIGAHGRGPDATCKLIASVYADDLDAQEKPRLVTACLRGVGANLRAGDIVLIRQVLCEALEGGSLAPARDLAHFYTSIGDILRPAVEHFAQAREPLAVGLLGMHLAEFSVAARSECAWLEEQTETARGRALNLPTALAAARALDRELRAVLVHRGPWPQWFTDEWGLDTRTAPVAAVAQLG